MADSQAIANALTAALQPMVAAVTTATAAAVTPAAEAVPDAPGPPGPVTFARKQISSTTSFQATPSSTRAPWPNCPPLSHSTNQTSAFCWQNWGLL
jgi:hypothetical protein